MGSQLLLVSFFCNVALVWGKGYFTAAVFEHRPRGHDAIDPKKIVSSNLEYYDKAARVAANKGADIIVFNKFGIFPYNDDRKVTRDFMEPIPDPEKVKFNPCLYGESNVAILSELSCMAKKNNMYLVANLGDIHPCEGTCDANGLEECDERCPEDSVYIYNTAVAFDRKGNLIARYHNMHPYFENNNVPEDPEYVTFKTEIGTFGIIICFDSVFDKSVVLARDYGIDTIVFPTFWFDDILPFNSVEWQQSWAIANNVNLLGANTQTPGNGSLGSGIYSKDYGALVYTYEPDGESKLLVANLPNRKLEMPSEFSFNPSITIIKNFAKYLKIETGTEFPNQVHYKTAGPPNSLYTDYRVFKLQMENYNMVKLQEPGGYLEVCQNELCCKLNYLADNIAEDYYFAAFRGINSAGNYYHWCEESCLLVRCDPLGSRLCMVQPSRSTTIFQFLEINANFTSERIYSTVSKNKFRLAPKNEWTFERANANTSLQFKSSTDEPLLKAGLLGRCYEHDPPFIPWYKY